MSSFKLHCTFCVFTAGFLGLFLYQSLFPYQNVRPARIANLHELVCRLRQKGLELHAVPSREDGLWLNAIYLTNSDKSDSQLRALTVHPSKIDQWKGTVIVFSDNALWPHYTEDWGENCLRRDSFLFLGDKEILMQIAKVLDK